jgi:hypothetical protein
MTPKTIATFLILSAFATPGANSASAEERGFRDGNFRHGRGYHRMRPPVTVGGFVGLDAVGGNGNANGYGDWYGISSGHNDCPLFRQRVMTPDGWRVEMVPIC